MSNACEPRSPTKPIYSQPGLELGVRKGTRIVFPHPDDWIQSTYGLYDYEVTGVNVPEDKQRDPIIDLIGTGRPYNEWLLDPANGLERRPDSYGAVGPTAAWASDGECPSIGDLLFAMKYRDKIDTWLQSLGKGTLEAEMVSEETPTLTPWALSINANNRVTCFGYDATCKRAVIVNRFAAAWIFPLTPD